jgi:hypothetical protein
MNINQKLKNISSIENNNSYILDQILYSKIFITNLIEFKNFIHLNPFEYLQSIKNNNFNYKKFCPLYFLYNNQTVSIQDELKNLADNIKKNNMDIKIRFLKDIETNFYRVELNFIFIGFIIEHNVLNNPIHYFEKEFYLNLITKSNIRKMNNNIYWENLLFKNEYSNQNQNQNIKENGIFINTNGIQSDWSWNKIIFLNEKDYNKEEIDEILSYEDYWYKLFIKRNDSYIFIVKHDFQYIIKSDKKIFTYYGQLFILHYFALINLINNTEYQILLNEILKRGVQERLQFIFGCELKYYGGEYEPYWELKEREWNRIKIESLKF